MWLDLVPTAGLIALFEHRTGTVRMAAMLCGMAVVVGLAVMVFPDGLVEYRGLSGLGHGMMAAAIVWCLTTQEYRKEVAGLAGMFFTVKLMSEGWTGELFFETGEVGNIGLPVPMAHVAGAVSGALLALMAPLGRDTLGDSKTRRYTHGTDDTRIGDGHPVDATRLAITGDQSRGSSGGRIYHFRFGSRLPAAHGRSWN